MKEVKRVVGYCRVSTKEQAENFSLETQEQHIRKFCKQANFELVEVFIEPGASAKTTNRPKLQTLLEYCKKNKGHIHGVVFYSINRFSRDTADYQRTRRELRAIGCPLYSVTESFNETSSGKLLENMTVAFAQFDNDVRSEKTIDGMKTALTNGRWVHIAPIGYRNGMSRGAPSLIPDPERAPYIVFAFEQFASGAHSRTDILRMLNAQGMRTVKGRKIPQQTLERLLRNPLYYGVSAHPKWNLEVQGDWEPLITKELFDRVQARLNGKQSRHVRHDKRNADFPLRGLLRCAKCGTRLTASWAGGRSKPYPYYHCRNSKCLAVNIRKEKLEAMFLDLLQQTQLQPEYAALCREIVRDVWFERQHQRRIIRSNLERRIEKLQGDKNRLVDALVHKGVIDKETYDGQCESIKKEKEEVQWQLVSLDHETMDVEAVLAFAERVMVQADRLWEALGYEQRQRLQTLFFPEGIAFDGKKFGTAKTNSVFSMLSENAACFTRMATPAGIEPAPPT